MSLLYDQYADSLFGLVSRILGDDQIAEDVLQRTMLKVWNGIDGFDPAKASFFTWMSVIARNTALDQMRLKTFQDRQKTIQVDEVVYRPTISTPEGSSIDAAAQNISALMTNKNRPTVRTVTGNVNITKMGRTKVFNSPMTKAAINAAW